MKNHAAIHYAREGRRAQCGANQGQRMRARVAVTADRAAVMCVKCRRYLDSGDADRFEHLLASMRAAAKAAAAAVEGK